MTRMESRLLETVIRVISVIRGQFFLLNCTEAT